ncbi:G-protein coupled receptor moody [Holothuria leucospilota]|uniref:G-protein coupled receptor moody n=1 Tax=Holothuria leucospilota TaxID=206669 RepID=A0A9Q1C7N3_HOLLE|nr:G-protein coupled receptor moody [Holothuria leucospilota]
MACPKQVEWQRSHRYIEFEDYHRPFLFPLEFMSLAIVLVLAVLFNFATIITILRVPSLRQKLGNMLIINLCVMDLITSLGSMLFSFIDIFYEGYFLCAEAFCRIQGGLAVLGCFGNFAAILLIALHQFIGVFAADKTTITSKHIGLMIVGCWVFTLAMVIPSVTGIAATSVYTHGNHHCSPTWVQSCPYYITCVSIIYVITLPSIIICYCTLYWKVKTSREQLVIHEDKVQMDDRNLISKDQGTTSTRTKHDTSTTDQAIINDLSDSSSHLNSEVSMTVVKNSSPYSQASYKKLSAVKKSGSCQSGTSKTKSATSAKKKVTQSHEVHFRIALAGGLLCVTTVVCWTPFFVVYPCIRNEENSHTLSVSAMWLAYTNSVLDPIIYAIFDKKLRKAILNHFHFLWR